MTTGEGRLILEGSRKVIAFGKFEHTGGTIVNGVTLQFGNGTSAEDPGPGTLGNVVLNNNATLAFVPGYQQDYTLASAHISGEGNLRIAPNAGQKVTLNGSSTLAHTGTTEVVTGALEIGGSVSLASTSALTLNPGTILIDSTGTSGQNLQRLVVYGGPGGVTYEGSFHADALDFHIPSTANPGDTMFTVNGTADITGSTLKVVQDGGSSALGMGDTVNLIQATSLVGAPANASSLDYGLTTGTQGALIAYAFDNEWDSSTGILRARVAGARIREESKSLLEGHLSGTAALVRSGDFVASQGIAAARAQLARSYGDNDEGNDDGDSMPALGKGLGGSGLQPFYAHGGGRVRYNSGSHVDTQGYNFMAGAVAGYRAPKGEVIAGLFFEYGKARYDAYNAFAAASEVTGDGDTHHRGGGLFGRIDLTNGLYVEGSVRRGTVDTTFQSDYLHDHFGTRAAYTAKSVYTGAHLGVGKLWPLPAVSEKLSLDTYAQALWTRQDADTVVLTTGERLSFDRVSSQRLKAGARLNYELFERSTVYAGFAYDHESDGEVRARLKEYGGAELPSPKMTGGTSMIEVGVLMTPKTRSPLAVDFGIQGHAGKREGITGSLKLNYYF
jgi:hypothetical protein